MFTVYILYSEKLDKYYIGSTGDFEGRLSRHRTANSGFTSRGKPWELVYTEEYLIRREALQREQQLKSWKNRERLEAIIRKNHNS